VARRVGGETSHAFGVDHDVSTRNVASGSAVPLQAVTKRPAEDEPYSIAFACDFSELGKALFKPSESSSQLPNVRIWIAAHSACR